MRLREFAKALGVDRHVAARVAGMIPGVTRVAGGAGQFQRFEIPDSAVGQVTEEMLAEARDALSAKTPVESLPSDPVLQKEEQAIRREQLAAEKARAETARLRAESELTDARAQRTEAERQRREQEALARRRHKLGLAQLTEQRDALRQGIQRLEQDRATLHAELDDLGKHAAGAEKYLDALRRAETVDRECAESARAERAAAEEELEGVRRALVAAQAELVGAKADLKEAREAGEALMAEGQRTVEAARERVAALEADEAAWRDATRLFMALWRGPIMGTVLRALLTVAGILVEGNSLTGPEEARVLAELRGRLLRLLLPNGAGELQAAMEEIARLTDRGDLSNAERLAEVGRLAQNALARGGEASAE